LQAAAAISRRHCRHCRDSYAACHCHFMISFAFRRCRRFIFQYVHHFMPLRHIDNIIFIFHFPTYFISLPPFHAIFTITSFSFFTPHYAMPASGCHFADYAAAIIS